MSTDKGRVGYTNAGTAMLWDFMLLLKPHLSLYKAGPELYTRYIKKSRRLLCMVRSIRVKINNPSVCPYLRTHVERCGRHMYITWEWMVVSLDIIHVACSMATSMVWLYWFCPNTPPTEVGTASRPRNKSSVSQAEKRWETHERKRKIYFSISSQIWSISVLSWFFFFWSFASSE